MDLIRKWIPYAIIAFYRLLSRTWRFEHIGHPNGADAPVRGPLIYAHWHGDELALVGAYAWRGMAVLSSQSRDGAIMTRFLEWFGYRVLRGSSSRGAVRGLKGLVDMVQRFDCESSLAVDGPRGPIYIVKPGILKLAQLTSGKVVPGAVAARKKIVFKKAWNRCYLPVPFSRCIIVYGAPIHVAQDASEEELETLRGFLESELRRLKSDAEQRVTKRP